MKRIAALTSLAALSTMALTTCDRPNPELQAAQAQTDAMVKALQARANESDVQKYGQRAVTAHNIAAGRMLCLRYSMGAVDSMAYYSACERAAIKWAQHSDTMLQRPQDDDLTGIGDTSFPGMPAP